MSVRRYSRKSTASMGKKIRLLSKPKVTRSHAPTGKNAYCSQNRQLYFCRGYFKLIFHGKIAYNGGRHYCHKLNHFKQEFSYIHIFTLCAANMYESAQRRTVGSFVLSLTCYVPLWAAFVHFSKRSRYFQGGRYGPCSQLSPYLSAKSGCRSRLV